MPSSPRSSTSLSRAALPLAALAFLAACGPAESPSGAGGSAGAGGGSGAGGSTATSTPTSYHAAPWTPLQDPVFLGQFGPENPLAGDPSVLQVANEFRLYHTCYAIDRGGADTCLATSPDGETWTLVDTGDPQSLGRVLRSDLDAWDAAHETPFALQWKGETWLYAIGYADPAAGFIGSPPVHFAVARSEDGVHFSPTEGPLFELTPGLDAHGPTSPTLVETGDTLTMLYTGWCLDPATCPDLADGQYLRPMAATSTDGLTWQKHAAPIELSPSVPWASEGIAETFLMRDPTTDLYLLFFTGLSSAENVLGLAWSPSPFGPFTVLPDPILTPEDFGPWSNGGLVAPHVLVTADAAYLWFAGEEKDPATGALLTYRIGLAKATGPLLLPD